MAVQGVSTAATEDSAAINGLALNGAVGVYGASSQAIGVWGATSGSQYGVYGITGGTGAGVFGVYSSCNCGTGSGFGAVGGVSLSPGIPGILWPGSDRERLGSSQLRRRERRLPNLRR